MSMDVGTLVISMMADVAQLKRDMGDAKSSVGSTMADIEKSIGYVKTAVIAFTGISGMDAFRGMIEGSLASVAGLHELSIKTGATVESMSALVSIGKITGTTGDEIAGMMNRLAKNMAVGNEESKGAAQAIAALGLNFDEFKSMSPDEKMVALAESLNEVQDGSDKSAIAITLMGRSGANALPYLKELAEAGTLNAKVTKEQADQAHQFEQDMARLKVSGEAWKKELALGMLPALQEAATATLGLVNESGGLRDEVKRLAADGSIAQWTRGAITGLTYVMDAFSYFKDLVQSVGIVVGNFIFGFLDGLGTLGTVIVKVIKGEYGSAMGEVVAWNERARERDKLLDTSMKETWGGDTLGQRLRDRIKDVKEVGAAVDEEKRAIDFNADSMKKQKEAADQAAKAGLDFATASESLVGQLQQQLDVGHKLSPAESELLKLEQQLTSGKISMTAETQAMTRAYLEHAQQLEKNIKAVAEEKKLQEEIAKDRDAAAIASRKETEAMQTENEKMADAIEKLGYTKEGWAAVTKERLIHKAEQLEAIANTIDENGRIGDTNENLDKQARLLRDRAELVGKGIVAAEALEAQKAWEKTTKAIGDGLSSALTDALMNGRSLWDAFKNYLINTILDGAIKNALSSVIQGGINSMLGSLGINVAGSAASTAAGGAAGGGGLLSAAGSALGVNGAGFTGTGVSGALGIGASAGTGVTTAGVTSGTAVGVDLGLLGSETAAGTAGAGTAGAGTAGVGMGAFSVLGYTAAFFAFASLLHGLAGSKDSVAVGTQDITGMTDKLTRQQETMSGWIDVPIHSVVAQKRRFLDDNSIFYQIFGDGVPLGTVDATDLTKQYGIPAFASGTDYFGGGVRLVGERGPELEVTGPSRIFDAQTTASMLRSGGASNDEVVTELATMRQILMGVLANTRRTANATNGQGEAPMITVVDA